MFGHAAFGHVGLNHRGQDEAEQKGPEHGPKHRERSVEPLADEMHDEHHTRAEVARVAPDFMLAEWRGYDDCGVLTAPASPDHMRYAGNSRRACRST